MRKGEREKGRKEENIFAVLNDKYLHLCDWEVFSKKHLEMVRDDNDHFQIAENALEIAILWEEIVSCIQIFLLISPDFLGCFVVLWLGFFEFLN